MSELVVAKAGGTSNATAEAVGLSLEWAEQSSIFVVSAAGKLPEFKGSEDALDEGNKVTNLTMIARGQYLRGDDTRPAAAMVRNRIAPIVRGTDGCSLSAQWLDDIPARLEQAIRHGYQSAFMFGEQIQSEIYENLGFTLLDPGRAPHDLGSDPEAWRVWLSPQVKKGNHYVIPGNITRTGGRLAIFDGGGSDITGGLAAYGSCADLNLNLTDGRAMSADPRKIDPKRLQPIDHMPYNVARELGRAGNNLVHAAAMVPLMRGDIPTEVRSTFDRSQPATLLDNDSKRASERDGQVLALSLMHEMDIIQVDEPGMAEAQGRLADLDYRLANHGVTLVDSRGAGVDTQRYFVAKVHGEAALEALRSAVRHGGNVTTRESGVDLVTMAGHNLELSLVNLIHRMAKAGVLDDAWQQQGHDLSHGSHSLRLSVNPGQGKTVLDRLHQTFIENNAA